MDNIKSANELDQCDIIITGDINFSQNNWETLYSPHSFEIKILEKLIELIFTQHAQTQFDVALSSKNW